MESNGYITKVNQPTKWVSSMVVSVRNEKIRICLDPRDLNKVISREHHPMKSIDDVIQDIPNAKVFSVLDAKSGFLQIKLDEESSYLTTMNTPIGRYRWLRLPFGIKCAPEIYQRIVDEMLEGIEGASAIIDDILIAGRDLEHHDKILEQVIERPTEYNLRLNLKKCHIRKTHVKYMDHILTSEGLLPDPDKIRAITEMPPPTDNDGLRRFLGLIQYLAKFLPNLSQEDAPLRVLLKQDVEFVWNNEQENSFKRLKDLCSKPPILTYFTVNKPVEIECDSSKDGVGAVLMQEGRVVAYASRALTTTEQGYAQIEKEMLSIVFSVNRFHCYVFGKETIVYNDHKPLEQIFNKPLLATPMRLQKMRLKLQWYDLDIRHRKGSKMHISDALSRAYLSESETDSERFENTSVLMISVSKEKYSEIQCKTQSELSILQEVIQEGWSDSKSDAPVEVRSYWDSRDQLSVSDGVIYKGLRIVIPPTLRNHMLRLIHSSHLGMVKCKQRAREVMFWPGMNADIEGIIRDCCKCAELQNEQAAEPLKPTPVPELPYSMVVCDLFDFEGHKYLILVDYYSKYIDTVKLNGENTGIVIDAMKGVFACHGIPSRLRTDNGPQFSSQEFKTFCAKFEIQHETSSPNFQSSNGEAERAVQTVKRLWKKTDDKSLALLDYRTTPLAGIDLSPSQLLMGRRPRNTLLASSELLKPQSYNANQVKNKMTTQKMNQKKYYDRRRGVQELKPLHVDTQVRFSKGNNSWKPGVVVDKSDHI